MIFVISGHTSDIGLWPTEVFADKEACRKAFLKYAADHGTGSVTETHNGEIAFCADGAIRWEKKEIDLMEKKESAADKAIRKFKESWEFDDIDEKTFETRSFRSILAANLEGEDDVVSCVMRLLDLYRYGDTSDPDDMKATQKDVRKRFPHGPGRRQKWEL